MKKKSNFAANNTKIAIVFFLFLIFIVGISFVFKLVIAIKESHFKGYGRFTMTVSNNRNIEVISLSPGSKDIVVFKLSDITSSAEAGRILQVPIDGFIASDSVNLNQKIDLLFTKALFNYNKLKTNLTIIDIAKIVMFARAVPENSVNVKVVGDRNRLDLDRIVNRLVSDDLIEKDKQTIRIVNATAVSGFGSRLARFITNMGGDVIIVATENSLKKKSLISYIDKKTYTVKRLQEVLGYEVVKEEENAISDITITIGEDKINSIPF